MKTHKVDPNKIRPGLANFTLEFHYAEKPKETVLGSNDALNQRWLRLVEIPLAGETPRKTVWHEIYPEDLLSSATFAKWVKGRCSQFRWSGKKKELYKLTGIMCDMASREIVAKRGMATTDEVRSLPEEE